VGPIHAVAKVAFKVWTSTHPIENSTRVCSRRL
jgi:hypothetical protein